MGPQASISFNAEVISRATATLLGNLVSTCGRPFGGQSMIKDKGKYSKRVDWLDSPALKLSGWQFLCSVSHSEPEIRVPHIPPNYHIIRVYVVFSSLFNHSPCLQHE